MRLSPTVPLVIGFLRVLGLMNAAVWLGSAVFFVIGAEPATGSQQMTELIGTRNFPFFSVAIEQIISARFLRIYLLCAAVAVVHLGAEWLYLGRYPKRRWLGIVVALCFLGLIQAMIVGPALRKSHHVNFRQNVTTQERESAAKSYRSWHRVSASLNWVMVFGLGFHLWRVATPSASTRFLSARQFRS